MGFIYKVTNNQNGKIYIGKTTETVEKRLKEHFEAASIKDDTNRPFLQAIRKYGIEHFSIETIEEVESSQLNEREKYWIEYYHSYINDGSNGYNATRGGDGTLTYDYSLIVKDYLKTHSKEQTAKNIGCCLETVRKACNEFHITNFSNATGVAVIRIDPETNEQKQYKTITQASEDIASILGNNPHTVRKRITDVIRNKPNQKAYGYYWKELKY